MSGIAGIFHRDDSPLDPCDIRRMKASLAHRGGDAAGVWQNNHVGFIHQALWTTPEMVSERMPMVSPDNSLALTADARIDNRADLLRELGGTNEGARLTTQSGDGEFILAAYRRWGTQSAERLLGDFAFAIWDDRNQILFAARDHFGVKPFFYTHAPRTNHKAFAFASEIKALMRLPGVGETVNERWMASYLLLALDDQQATLYDDVWRLPPGHTITVNNDSTEPRLRSYWSLDSRREIRFRRDEDYREAFHEIFTEAVRCRLRSHVRVGSTLSGGLDSSSITCVARDLQAAKGAPPLATFSAVYDEVPACDEREYIKAVIAQGGIEPHFGHPDRLSPLGLQDEIERMTNLPDEPVLNPQTPLHWVLYDAARADDVRVLLDGLGGDVTLSHSRGYFAELFLKGQWLRLASEARAMKRLYGRPLRSTILRSVIGRLTPGAIRRLARRTLRVNTAATSGVPFHSAFAQRAGTAAIAAKSKAQRRARVTNSRQAHFALLTSGANCFSLNLVDRTAALFGIEGRYPFYDRRLAEFCLALPANQKMRAGLTRAILRDALVKTLPAEVRTRRDKADHSPNFNRGLRFADSEHLTNLVSANACVSGAYFDMEIVGEMVRRFLASDDDAVGFVIWRVAMIARWLDNLPSRRLVNMSHEPLIFDKLTTQEKFV
jgi:asparagine synthase (glutamine-hydrolysing)